MVLKNIHVRWRKRQTEGKGEKTDKKKKKLSRRLTKNETFVGKRKEKKRTETERVKLRIN